MATFDCTIARQLIGAVMADDKASTDRPCHDTRRRAHDPARRGCSCPSGSRISLDFHVKSWYGAFRLQANEYENTITIQNQRTWLAKESET